MEGCCECVDAKSLGCCPGCLIKLTERCPAVGSFVSKLSAVVADAAAVERSMVQVGAQRGWFKDSMRVLG